jgi:hypothetical protein
VNWTDYFLNVGAFAIIPLILAAYGGKVAAESIPDKSHGRSVTRIFWGWCLIGIAFAAWYQYRIAKSDSSRQESIARWQTGMDTKLDQIIRHPASAEQQRAAIDLKHEITSQAKTVSNPNSKDIKSLNLLDNISDENLRDKDNIVIKQLNAAWEIFDADDNLLIDRGSVLPPGIEKNKVGLQRGTLRIKFESENRDLLAQAINLKDASVKRPALDPETIRLKHIIARFADLADAIGKN